MTEQMAPSPVAPSRKRALETASPASLISMMALSTPPVTDKAAGRSACKDSSRNGQQLATSLDVNQPGDALPNNGAGSMAGTTAEADNIRAEATAGAPTPKRRKWVSEVQAPQADAAASFGAAKWDAEQPGWWLPQPHPSLDPTHTELRPAAPLASALSCCLCQGLLREATVALECGHTYCYDCVDARVEVGGRHNVCPVQGCGVVLGPNPWDHHKLMHDPLLDTLVAKVFPRAGLDAELARRREEREEATRRAKRQLQLAARGRSDSPDGVGDNDD